MPHGRMRYLIVVSCAVLAALGLDAVLRQDYPVVQGIALWIALVYLAVNTAADVIVRQLDPRVAA